MIIHLTKPFRLKSHKGAWNVLAWSKYQAGPFENKREAVQAMIRLAIENRTYTKIHAQFRITDISTITPRSW
jgi:hypothetical protein